MKYLLLFLSNFYQKINNTIIKIKGISMEEDIIKLQKANKTNFEVLDKENEIFNILKSDENNDFILINSSLIRKSSVQSI